MGITQLKQALLYAKLAEVLRNNDAVPGRSNVYPEPAEEEDTTSDSHSTGALKASRQGRSEMLDRLFTDIPRGDRAFVAAHFSHGKSGQYEAHSPLLSKEAAAAHAPPAPTLVEQVRTVLGRR